MLRREEAEKRLKQFQINNWEKSRLQAIGKLPERPRLIGRMLFNLDAQGKAFKGWQKRQDALIEILRQLPQLTVKERQQLFATLFPQLATYLEAAWNLLDKLPYETASDRKGFRAPGEQAIHAARRWEWLCNIFESLKGYDPDITWCAAWAPHLSGYWAADQLGLLLAAAVEKGGKEGEEVFSILRDSASNQHEIGSMGRHVTRALLVCSRPEAWDFMEKLLLAAQRQEGLRSVILETIDEAHPQAFVRMVKLILEHNLLRFAATVRAVDVWFGLQWSALTPATLRKSLEQVIRLLEDESYRQEVIANEADESLYLALWSIAFHDARAAVEPAAALLKDPKVERRFIATRFLGDLELPAARARLIEALADQDLRVALTALDNLSFSEEAEVDLWDHLVALFHRIPEKRQTGEALVWPWTQVTIDRKEVAGHLVDALGKRPATALLPYLKYLQSWHRASLVERLGTLKKWDDTVRDTLFGMIGDRDSYVREKALAALKKCDITEADAQRIEGLLVRKGADMRRAVLTLLLKQKQPQALVSVDRLLGSKKVPQRQAGLEMLRLMVEKKRAVAECRQRAETYRQKFQPLSEEEELHLEVIFDQQREKPTLDNGLGLFDPSQCSPRLEPKKHKVVVCTAATVKLLTDLDKLIHQHRETPIQVETYDGSEEQLLGNTSWWLFPTPDVRKPIERQLDKLPLAEVWQKWFAERPKTLRDNDGLELLRAYLWADLGPREWKELVEQFGKPWASWMQLALNGQKLVTLKYQGLVRQVLLWLLRLHPPAGAIDFLLDVVETGFAHVPDSARKVAVKLDDWNKRRKDWRIHSPLEHWAEELNLSTTYLSDLWTEAHRLRYWQLLHWRDQPAEGVARIRPSLDVVVTAFKAGVANEADVIDQIIGPGLDRFSDLAHLTDPKNRHVKDCPQLLPIIQRVTNRVLEVELQRGEMPTAATKAAAAISHLSGLPMLRRLLDLLGKKPLARQTHGEGRIEQLTHLIMVTHPTLEDTPEQFAAQATQAKWPRERLLQLAFLAPQWLDHIEYALGWSGLKEAVWWLLAHSPGGRHGTGTTSSDDDFLYDVDDLESSKSQAETSADKLAAWEQILRERTALTEEDRSRGAVDADWFYRVHAALGKKHWDELVEYAKFGTSYGAGHKKALLAADVLLGRAKKSELIANIRQRKLKESVRLLGLLPLPEGDKREAELLNRYKVLIEYRRYARSLSPMSRPDAEQTATIGLENLARTAGYPDPIRLEWAMEAKQVADLATGPVSVNAEGVTVTLRITPDAQPEISIHRGEKVLKAVPPAVRKNPKVAELLERRADLKRQASRVKGSLETMMVRGDTFTGKELRQLFEHPLLQPVLSRLVVLGDGIRGYPVAEGKGLEDYNGKVEPIKPDEKLRLAHPHDLFAAGDWDQWQADCFRRERIQPFKQVFRELYVLTNQEKEDGSLSRRYAGQQIQPTQAMALWGTRGWNTKDGEIAKTFFEANLVAEVSFQFHGYTAAQVEGWTLDAIRFHRRGEWKPLPLDEVPPRLFSEVMRDCDLVVSVAHAGAIDPEASASTVQMRASLVRETCSLMRLDNYEFKGNHILIEGKLGRYSVHLGSGVVHRLPGGHVCIVPVHAQQRGRLFLPFADDDPRTAEVLSKVLLLARDDQIQDPSILEQLR